MGIIKRARPRLSAIAVLGIPLALVPALSAQDLPSAEEVLAAHVEAIGGADAIEAVDYRHIVSTTSMPALGVNVRMEMWQARPNRVLIVTSMPGMEMRQGFDGRVGWSIDPLQGGRLLTGPELDALARSSVFDANTRLADVYATHETVGRAEAQGRPCWQVRLAADSTEATACFDTETGLLLSMTAEETTPLGTLEGRMEFQDYRDFGGVRMPARVVSHTMGQEMVIQVEEVSTAPLDESIFALPPEIAPLVEDRPID